LGAETGQQLAGAAEERGRWLFAAGHRTGIVSGHSGIVTLNAAANTGHVRPESAVTMDQNQRSA